MGMNEKAPGRSSEQPDSCEGVQRHDPPRSVEAPSGNLRGTTVVDDSVTSRPRLSAPLDSRHLRFNLLFDYLMWNEIVSFVSIERISIHDNEGGATWLFWINPIMFNPDNGRRSILPCVLHDWR